MAITLPESDEEVVPESIPGADDLVSSEDERMQSVVQDLNRSGSRNLPQTPPSSATNNFQQTTSTAPPGWRGNLSRGMGRLMNRPQPAEAPSKTEQAKEAVKDKAKDAAKQEVKQVGKQAARQVGRAAVAQIARTAAAAAAAATSEIWVPILIIILVIIAAIMIFAISVGVGTSGVTGSSPFRTATETLRNKTLTFAGDIYARRKSDAEYKQKMLVQLDTIKQQATAKNDTAALSLIEQMRTKQDMYTSSDSRVDLQILKDLRALAGQLSAKGYGSTLTTYAAALNNNSIVNLISTDALIIAHGNDKQALLTGSPIIRETRESRGEAVPLNPMIPAMLVALSQDFKPMTVSSILGTHSRYVDREDDKKVQSGHWTGNGLDISQFKGQSVLSNKSLGCEVLQWVIDNRDRLEGLGIKIRQTIGPVQCRNLQIQLGQLVRDSNGTLSGVGTNHENHVHIGFDPVGSD